MRSFILGAVAVLCCASAALANEVRVVELKDGSIVTGEVQSLSNGVYTIRSESLGTIKLEESKVLAIRPTSSPTSATTNSVAAQAAGIQNKMMNDQEIMGMVQSLQNDPDFQGLLEDPEVMKAVNAGDVAALTANPRFMKLLNNATVQKIQKKVN